MTVRVGGGKKVTVGGRRGPPSLPEAPSEGGLSTPVEETLEPAEEKETIYGYEAYYKALQYTVLLLVRDHSMCGIMKLSFVKGMTI